MPVNAPQTVNVTCPACRTQYSTQVRNVVDVGQEPRLKSMLLQGRLNIGVCPQCGTGGVLGLPFTYHDPQKELLFCLLPQKLRMSEADRQRSIGQMSNAIINALPSEQRKGYLLRPRVFLTFQTLAEAILEADGVTKEMLRAQQEQARLLSQMVQTADDPLSLAALIGEHESKITHAFFALLSAQIDSAQQQSQSEAAEKLTGLRDTLLERTAVGQQISKEQQSIAEALEGIDKDLTRESLLDRVIAAMGDHEDQILQVLIALARPLFDYRFFQLLTERIDPASSGRDSESADKLRALRTKILEAVQRLDAEAREQVQEKTRLLSEIIRSPDREAAIQERLDEIDETFMSVLETNIAQSEQQSQHEAAEAFRAIRGAILRIFQESAPPVVQFVNKLLGAEYPDETREILMDNQAMVTPDLLNLMDSLSADLVDRGQEQVSDRLKKVRAQAELQVK